LFFGDTPEKLSSLANFSDNTSVGGKIVIQQFTKCLSPTANALVAVTLFLFIDDSVENLTDK